jgi:hypothetical protein
LKYDELQEEKHCGGESDKRYVYYRNSDRKRTALQILRQRPVTLLVRVGWGLDGVFGRQQEPMGVFFTQQMKEVAQLTLFVNLMQAHGILRCDVILILAWGGGDFRMEFW